jgi:leucyl aminopeptidase
MVIEVFPTKLSYTAKLLEPLFDHISIPEMTKFLTSFSAFRTRYYRSSTGKESQQFLLKHLKDVRRPLSPRWLHRDSRP